MDWVKALVLGVWIGTVIGMALAAFMAGATRCELVNERDLTKE